jgi:hypothetical protein
MENEFITYELALRMKQLGFDEPCMGVYYGDEDDIQFVLNVRETQYYAQKGYKNGILASTWQSAFRWFREKYGLEGVIQQAEDYIWYKWEISQYNENGKKYVYDWYEYKTYEEAELACFEKLIEIVEQEYEKEK